MLRKPLLTICLVLLLPASARAQETVTYYHNDALGSPIAATDATGVVIWREQYRPFGQRIINDAASIDTSMWFTGHREDTESGLIYMGARYYDPVAGRFMGMDPVAVKETDPRTFNRYSYAANNPYRYIDPDGRDAEATHDGGGETTGWIQETWDGIKNQIKENIEESLDWPSMDDLLQNPDERTPEQKAELEKKMGEMIEGFVPFGGVTKVVLKGGHKMTEAAAKALNEYMGTNYHRRVLGRALEKLRKHVRNDDHGKVLNNGEAFRKNGESVGNIWDAMP